MKPYIPPIKRFIDDESLPWEERFRRLEEHHVKETTLLYGAVEERDNALHVAWGIIANVSGGSWITQSEEWNLAAATFRDELHRRMK